MGLIRSLCLPWGLRKSQRVLTTVRVRLYSGRPRVNAYKQPSPSISSIAHVQFAEGLHFSAFHYQENVELEGQLRRKEAELAEAQGQLRQKVSMSHVQLQVNKCSLFLTAGGTANKNSAIQKLPTKTESKCAKVLCGCFRVYNFAGRTATVQ